MDFHITISHWRWQTVGSKDCTSQPQVDHVEFEEVTGDVSTIQGSCLPGITQHNVLYMPLKHQWK
jgi:hypothetical protein